ncbi:Pycsar system effector family protein [Streptomyces cucumeris]|uniref:Pycsar system effector family protein n=1 Tax=Streptomyces cucumeris TaxID=2962890 RepID=UPI003D706D72
MSTHGSGTRAGHGGELEHILISETREELLKADSKAGVMLTALGAALTTLLGTISAGGITPQEYAPVPQTLFWAGCAAWIPALVMFGLAVVPRAGKPQRSRAHYFGDAAGTSSVELFAELVRRTDPRERNLSQCIVLSRTVWLKYRCIRHGMIWSAVFLVLTPFGLLTGASV